MRGGFGLLNTILPPSVITIIVFFRWCILLIRLVFCSKQDIALNFYVQSDTWSALLNRFIKLLWLCKLTINRFIESKKGNITHNEGVLLVCWKIHLSGSTQFCPAIQRNNITSTPDENPRIVQLWHMGTTAHHHHHTTTFCVPRNELIRRSFPLI